MPADKVNTPATETAEAAPVTTEQTPVAGQAAAPAGETTALQQALETERKARIEQERQYSELRSKFNARDQEIAQLRALRDSVFAGQGEAEQETPAVDPRIAREVLATREEVAWMRFQQNHPKYAEFWDDMKEVAKDPVYKRTIESYREGPDGRLVLDTFATLHNAYNEVELRRIKAAQATHAASRADEAAQANKIVSRAVVSGEGAGSLDQSGQGTLTLEQFMALPYNEMIKHMPVDPNDPPRGI